MFSTYYRAKRAFDILSRPSEWSSPYEKAQLGIEAFEVRTQGFEDLSGLAEFGWEQARVWSLSQLNNWPLPPGLPRMRLFGRSRGSNPCGCRRDDSFRFGG